VREDAEDGDEKTRKEQPAHRQETRHASSVVRVEIVVNGKPRSVDAGVTVSDLIAELGLTVKNVVVEQNGEPLERAKFALATVASGDSLEIVRAVPGG